MPRRARQPWPRSRKAGGAIKIDGRSVRLNAASGHATGRLSRRELVRPSILRDRTGRAGVCAYCGRAKFATHLNSNSQPSAKLVVLFSQTDGILRAAFFKNIAVRHVTPPKVKSQRRRAAFEPGLAFCDLNVCVPHTPKIRSNVD